MREKFKYWILPIIFFGSLYFLFFNQIFEWKTFYNHSENRALSPAPEFDVKHLDYFPGEYDDYLMDHFSFRGLFLNAYHSSKFWMNVSPNLDDIFVGKNGNYFLAQRDIEVFKGKRVFGENELNRFVDSLKTKDKVIGGSPFFWLIGPNKLHIYTEDLPTGIHEIGKNRSKVLKEFLDKDFPNRIIYPMEELIKNKEYAYYKYDNHWTEKGCFIAYQEIMKAMQMEIPDLIGLKESDITWEKEVHPDGNLLKFIGKEDLVEEILAPILPSLETYKVDGFNFPIPASFPYPDDYEYHFINPNALNKKRVLVVRDSFGDNMMRILNETFEETLYIFNDWTYAVSKEIIQTYNPDIVVFITMETLLDNILDYPQVTD